MELFRVFIAAIIAIIVTFYGVGSIVTVPIPGRKAISVLIQHFSDQRCIGWRLSIEILSSSCYQIR